MVGLEALAVFGLLAAGSQVDAPTAPTGPTPRGDVPIVVWELNELCGDVWCEGEYEYVFTSCLCDASSCTITFEESRHDSGRTSPVTRSVEVAQPVLEEYGDGEYGMHPDAMWQFGERLDALYR